MDDQPKRIWLAVTGGEGPRPFYRAAMTSRPGEPAVEYIHHDEMESIVRETTFDLEAKVEHLRAARERWKRSAKRNRGECLEWIGRMQRQRERTVGE